MPTKRTDLKYIRAYDRGMLRSAFVSLFWGIIMERKRRGSFTLQALAKILGTNKGEVSRWFNGDPNWTVNTIANLASSLDVDIEIRAVDRVTGAVFLPSGMVAVQTTSTQPNPIIGARALSSANLVPRRITVTHLPEGSFPPKISGFEEAAAA